MGNNVGENIKQKRKELGFSQIKLSRLSGISQSAISDIENPYATKRPNTDTISKIASALCCSVAELMGERIINDERLPSNNEFSASIPNDEKELIQLYRSLNNEAKRTVLETVRGFAGNPAMQKDESDTATA